MNAERQRLAEADAGGRPWRRFGPYLAERQWGTVREDYSAAGDVWGYFPHDMAHRRAYRWGEDGLLGLSDDRQLLCFALALWNGRDPVLKERLFGVSGPQGNHGEDVKEVYYYLDATPTSAYLRALYRYPQAEFPYAWLVEENGRRSRHEPEFELVDTGVFAEDRYFDVEVEYAKADAEDVLVRVTVTNRGPEPARLELLPQLWFRNVWSWSAPAPERPVLRAERGRVHALHPDLGEMWLAAEGAPELLFCDNDSNAERLWGSAARPGFWKDGIHEYLIHGVEGAVNPARAGTKVAARYVLALGAGESRGVRLRLSRSRHEQPFAEFDDVFAARLAEADEFYATLPWAAAGEEPRRVQRQAYAGLLWTRQFYHYDVPRWLAGDPTQPAPPAERLEGRNHEWFHLNNADIVSVPDAWEYPWYAAWDLAFHCVPLAQLDPEFAKGQLILLTREWYMHPNGQLPAYEWQLGDVNPPVHAWAALRVYEIDRELSGRPDRAFLERVFHKLMLNFTWWVNRKDVEGRNVFQGGFLGLDNIGLFDRSSELPTGGHLDQADGTGWMAMYSLNLLRIALELAQEDAVYEDIATKFFEHFLYVAAALTNLGGQGEDFWDDDDRFFYDLLHLPDGRLERLRVRSMVGLIPLFAVEILDTALLARLPDFRARMEWFLAYRPDLAGLVSHFREPGMEDRRLLSLLRRYRLKSVLERLLDEREFLSPYGVRALSRHHLAEPYVLHLDGHEFSVAYQPGESDSGLFGGNSNWRGPVWLPMNYLILEALRRFGRYYGADFQVELPTGSGHLVTLDQAADEIERRLVAIFLPDAEGKRPVYGHDPKAQGDPRWNDKVLFYECFHGDDGHGVGASHQTGWTALVADLLRQK